MNYWVDVIFTAQDTTPPQLGGVAPWSGSGWSQTFGFYYSDPDGSGNLVSAQVDFNTALAASNSCYLYIGLSWAASIWLITTTTGKAP